MISANIRELSEWCCAPYFSRAITKVHIIILHNKVNYIDLYYFFTTKNGLLHHVAVFFIIFFFPPLKLNYTWFICIWPSHQSLVTEIGNIQPLKIWSFGRWSVYCSPVQCRCWSSETLWSQAWLEPRVHCSFNATSWLFLHCNYIILPFMQQWSLGTNGYSQYNSLIISIQFDN